MAGQTLANGQIIPPEVTMKTLPAQNIQGGLLNAAADKTIASTAHQVEVAQKMGAGQKGAGRRRKVKRGGSTNYNVPASNLPSASSIPGVGDPTDVSKAHIDTLNAIRAAAAGDKLANAAPYYPAKSGGKRTKRKSKHGRRHHRTHRRGNSKSAHGRRRSRRNV